MTRITDPRVALSRATQAMLYQAIAKGSAHAKEASGGDPVLDKFCDDAIKVHQGGDVRRAMKMYREILVKDPRNIKALYFTAVALSQDNQADLNETYKIMAGAIKFLRHIPEAHYNLGIMLHRMGREDEALESFELATKLLESLVEAKTSLGGAYLNMGKREKGRQWLENAARTQTRSLDSIYSRGFAKLTIGQLDEGWKDYEFRWKSASFLVENRRQFPGSKLWDGRPIPGKTLYLHTEQGAGDMIMVSRFIAAVARQSQAGKVVLEVGQNVVDLLTPTPGLTHCVATNKPMPEEIGEVHFVCPMMSLMRHIGVRRMKHIVHGEGWLPLRTEPNFQVHLPSEESRRPRVGIAWAGSKAHKNDIYRSIHWGQWRELVLKDPRLAPFRPRFYSFQVGENARDIDDGGAELGVIDLTPQCAPSFAHTSTGLAQMDYLISVDTATIHVAASTVVGPRALGVLIPAAPDWRWGLYGDTTPWYDRMTLIRQTYYKDWNTPLQELAGWLAQQLATWSPPA